jgi:hypothetical protein
MGRTLSAIFAKLASNAESGEGHNCKATKLYSPSSCSHKPLMRLVTSQARSKTSIVSVKKQVIVP